MSGFQAYQGLDTPREAAWGLGWPEALHTGCLSMPRSVVRASDSGGKGWEAVFYLIKNATDKLKT